MASTLNLYIPFLRVLSASSVMRLDDGNVKLALVTSGYTFDQMHSTWSQVSPYEVASGNGYTTGGVALSYSSVGAPNNATQSLDYANPSWAALTKTFRFGILYWAAATATGSSKIVNPLIGCILFDNTPADIEVVAQTFDVRISADGLIQQAAET